MIKAGVSRNTKCKGSSAPYTRDVVVNPISKGLCRVKTHSLKGSRGIGKTCCAEV